MKILHLGKFYYPTPGGIETQLRSLVAGLNELGVSQRVIVANTKRHTERDVVDGIEIVRLSCPGILFSTPLSFGWRGSIREREYDIIHLHAPNPTATMSLAPVGTPGRLVVSYHADIVKQKYLKRFYDPIFRRVLDRADKIVIASPAVESYDPILRPFARKCVPIGYGINVQRFTETPGIRAGAERIRDGLGGPVILFVGRLVYYKGLRVLLSAMGSVDGNLVIVGTGPEEEGMKKMARDLGIGHKVSFKGFVPEAEIPSYYHACDVLCLPSIAKSEAFGIVQLEAMACGKPVVSTELGTATSIVNRHGVTGFVVPPNDVDALADALKKIVNNDVLRRQFGNNARERVMKEFDYKLIAGKYYELYQSCL